MVDSFITDINDIAEKYFEDFDHNDYIKQIKRHFLKDIVNLNLNDLIVSSEIEDEELSWMEKGFLLLDNQLFNILHGSINLISAKEEEKKWINNFFYLIELERIKKHVEESGNVLIENIKSDIIKDFVLPIKEKTEQLIADKSNKAENINILENKLKILKESLNSHKSQIEEMEILEKTL